MSKLSRPIYILMVIFLCCITTNLHSQDVVLLGGDLIIINSKCETFTLNKLLRFNKNTFAIVFKGASCSECIEKAYEFAHKARLLNPNMNIMVLSNYSSCRVQRILEVKYDLNEGIYSVDEEAIEQFSSAYTPVVILLKSTGKVLNKEYIDDRNIVDILNELKKKSGFVE